MALRVYMSVRTKQLILEVERKLNLFLQEARKLAISRPVEMDKLEEGVHQSINTVNVNLITCTLPYSCPLATAEIVP